MLKRWHSRTERALRQLAVWNRYDVLVVWMTGIPIGAATQHKVTNRSGQRLMFAYNGRQH